MLPTVTVAVQIPEGFFPDVSPVKYGNVQSKRTSKIVQHARIIPVKSFKSSFRMIQMQGAGLKRSGEAINACENFLMTCSFDPFSNLFEIPV
jgi:hypothetical protein